MSSRFIRFDPDTTHLLDRCMNRAQEIATNLGPQEDTTDTRTRLAMALIEAAAQGERDEEELVEFALRALPAYRERRTAGPKASGDLKLDRKAVYPAEILHPWTT